MLLGGKAPFVVGIRGFERTNWSNILLAGGVLTLTPGCFCTKPTPSSRSIGDACQLQNRRAITAEFYNNIWTLNRELEMFFAWRGVSQGILTKLVGQFFEHNLFIKNFNDFIFAL